MAHAKLKDLKDIGELLVQIRALKKLKEKATGCFYLKSKAVLHFHVEAGRKFAHVFNGHSWLEIDIATGPSTRNQCGSFEKIRKILPIEN